MPSTKLANKHNARQRWNALPPGVCLTLEEAADIIGIAKDTLRKTYAHRYGLPLPIPAVFLRLKSGRAWGICRLPDSPPTPAPDHSTRRKK